MLCMASPTKLLGSYIHGSCKLTFVWFLSTCSSHPQLFPVCISERVPSVCLISGVRRNVLRQSVPSRPPPQDEQLKELQNRNTKSLAVIWNVKCTLNVLHCNVAQIVANTFHIAALIHSSNSRSVIQVLDATQTWGLAWIKLRILSSESGAF